MGILSQLLKQSREQREREFYYEYGRFMCAFARVETAVHSLFRRASGLTEEKARAIVGGENISNMMEFTKRITALKKTKWASKNAAEIEFLFNHLSAISTFRNGLIHGGADVEEETIRSVNYNKAKSFQTIQEMTFDLPVIQNASNDLSMITIRAHHLVRASNSSRKYIGQVRGTPWLYKSPKPNSYWGRMLAEAIRLRTPPQSSAA